MVDASLLWYSSAAIWTSQYCFLLGSIGCIRTRGRRAGAWGRHVHIYIRYDKMELRLLYRSLFQFLCAIFNSDSLGQSLSLLSASRELTRAYVRASHRVAVASRESLSSYFSACVSVQAPERCDLYATDFNHLWTQHLAHNK